MAKKTNWQVLQGKDSHDSMQYRDVYEDQQLERSKIQDKQSPLSRILITAVLTLMVAVVTWVAVGAVQYGMYQFSHGIGSATSTVSPGQSGEFSATYNPQEPYNYIGEEDSIVDGGGMKTMYFAKDVSGSRIGSKLYEDPKDVPQPDWYVKAKADYERKAATPDVEKKAELSSFGHYMMPDLWKVIVTLGVSAMFFAIVYQLMMRNLAAQNLMNDTSDINQYQNDQHIALPEEVQRKFDWFPDVGAHSNVQPSSMISHMALTNKGINKVDFARRAKEDIRDEDGDIEYLKGEILRDDDDNALTDKMPMFDEAFMQDLFTASGVKEDDKEIRKFYDPTAIPYNPKNANRDKQKGFDTVADLINGDWILPEYETQRPAGAYVVDIDPVNTMVLAITRAGKGQTIIEPTIDMWMRERRPNNMVINDPKGELLQKFYVPGTYRGFQIVQFNLINAMNTDIYNPLMMAAQSAREGDFTKCAMYTENIANVFFPVDGGDDPVWPNAANNAFKRAAYGLIDFYLEEEAELRLSAQRTGMDARVLEQKIDDMWGKVTLYNCYQLFTQLTSKKMKNPASEFAKKAKNGDFDKLSQEEYDAKLNEVEAKSKLWEDRPEADLLTLYFNATDMLPKNEMRTLVSNANNALKSMAGAEKMMSSVYGIAITAMSFFTDPTISTLTSGKPSQNVDLAGMSFPRRIGFRLSSDFVQRYHLLGMQCVWHAYEDKSFTKELKGKDFYHEDLVNTAGWALYYFKGIFPEKTTYLKCEIRNPQTSQLIRTFYFSFTKTYQTTLNGRTYMKDPILGDKIVKDGILQELRPVKAKDGSTVYKPGYVTYKTVKMKDIDTHPYKKEVRVRAITQHMTRYSEKPKMVFLVTPPHLMKYAKLILILIKQLVDLNFDQSYMKKSNQKPLFKTRFMLDELGNLQSEGHGIDGFQTMLSIGLGQDQQFTLILQTLQQLRDVYGDSVDKVIQGNTSNIVFLKSTDDSMLDTLQKMSGTTHRAFINSKTITRDTERIWMQNEGKTSYTMSVQEVPVISYNDMAFISPRNSIVFRAGDSPIWNRNETILPMSWRLLQNTIKQPGHDYTFQTIPTLSSAREFDRRKNQPDFGRMVDKRMAQAMAAENAKSAYQSIYGYDEWDIEQLDPDLYAAEIMEVINTSLTEAVDDGNSTDDYIDACIEEQESVRNLAEDNPEQARATAEAAEHQKNEDKLRFAHKKLSRSNLAPNGVANHSLDGEIIKAFVEAKGDMTNDHVNFVFGGGSLYSPTGVVYIMKASPTDDLNKINKAAKDKNSFVFAEGDIDPNDVKSIGTYTVTDDFIIWLARQENWRSFAKGRFDDEMARLLDE